MNKFKQILCRPVLLPLLLLGSLAPVASAALASQPSPSLDPALSAEPSVQLQSQVQQWAALKSRVALSQVEMVPLDPRMAVKGCDHPLQLDAPFTSLETVRVRCSAPVWQLYVRVAFKDGSVTAPQPVEVARVPEVKRKVLVASASLPRGTALTPELVALSEMDAALPGPQALERLVDIQHMELAREVRAGVPIRSFDLRPILMVKQGQMVVMQIGQGQGFRISARLEALQDGRMGQQIRLKNAESGRLLSGVVVGKDMVRGL